MRERERSGGWRRVVNVVVQRATRADTARCASGRSNALSLVEEDLNQRVRVRCCALVRVDLV